MLTYADACYVMGEMVSTRPTAYVSIRQHTSAYVTDEDTLVSTSATVSSRMRTYAGMSRRMLTYADVC
jgi:hypothetical protein